MRDADQGMVERIRRSYAPEPPGPGRRAALRAGIDARVQPRQHWLVAAALCAAVLLTVVVLFVRPTPAPEVGPLVGQGSDRWVEEVLFGAEQEETTVPLPAEYAVLSELLER